MSDTAVLPFLGPEAVHEPEIDLPAHAPAPEACLAGADASDTVSVCLQPGQSRQRGNIIVECASDGATLSIRKPWSHSANDLGQPIEEILTRYGGTPEADGSGGWTVPMHAWTDIAAEAGSLTRASGKPLKTGVNLAKALTPSGGADVLADVSGSHSINPMYRELVSDVVDAMREGWVPWEAGFDRHRGAHVNAFTNRPYNPINTLKCQLSTFKNHHVTHLWATRAQIEKAGGELLPDEVFRPTKVMNGYQLRDRKNDQEEQPLAHSGVNRGSPCEAQPQWRNHLRDVYNLSQTRGLDHLVDQHLAQSQQTEISEKPDIHRFIDRYAAETGIRYEHGPYNPLYCTQRDLICMPPIERYQDSDRYYSNYLHEIVHSTGHAQRLNRETLTCPSSDLHRYSIEELVAQFGSTSMCQRFGIELMENDISYISGWAERIEAKPNVLVRAAYHAQKAEEYLEQFMKETTP